MGGGAFTRTKDSVIRPDGMEEKRIEPEGQIGEPTEQTRTAHY